MKKWILRQKVWLVFVLLINAVLWAAPSDVVELIARDRHTLLGRYSREHFTINVVIGLLSIVSFYIDWATGAAYRRRWFRVIAASMVSIPPLLIADFLLRSPGHGHYVHDTLSYHRPPDSKFRIVFEDKPEAHRTYPNAPRGYGRVPCTLRTDARGYRNRHALDSYDVVILGDSFAEGSNVSDEHVWTVKVAQQTGLTVYNLGMSGYDPIHYLAAIRTHGSALRPKVVLCLLYEGNDFRSVQSDLKRRTPPFSERLERYRKQSPIVTALDRVMVETFGPMRSEAPVPGGEILNWMPLALPEGPNGRLYAFAPKQLRDLYQSAEEFSGSRPWRNTRRILSAIESEVEALGARFAIAYAPTKAHVVLPPAADRLPPEKVRALAAIRVERELPDATTFLNELLSTLDGMESVVARWSRQESVPFLSLTPPLREAAVSGLQVYYTYDQHWTPEGHTVAADAIIAFLETRLHGTKVSESGGNRAAGNRSDRAP